jgi:hypothetical protein
MTRRGIMLLELAAAATLLGALLVTSLQLAAALALQRRATEERQIATLEIGNVLERVAARSWAELKRGTAVAEHLSPTALGRLRAAELIVEITASTARPPAKRIVVSLRWRDVHGEMVAPLRVATWRYR